MRLDSCIQSATRLIWKLGVHKCIENHPKTKEKFTTFFSKTICAQDDLIKVKLLSIQVHGKKAKAQITRGKA